MCIIDPLSVSRAKFSTLVFAGWLDDRSLDCEEVFLVDFLLVVVPVIAEKKRNGHNEFFAKLSSISKRFEAIKFSANSTCLYFACHEARREVAYVLVSRICKTKNGHIGKVSN